MFLLQFTQHFERKMLINEALCYQKCQLQCTENVIYIYKFLILFLGEFAFFQSLKFGDQRLGVSKANMFCL